MITMSTTLGMIGIFHIIPITHIIHTDTIKEEIQMYYRYQPYPYYNRYYNINPYYYYRRYYNPYQNIIDSQIANVDQNLVNYGDMTDVIQNSDIYQSMTPEPENVGICTQAPTEPSSPELPA